jgi:rubredoxin
MNAIKESYPNGVCPDCGETIPDDVVNGQACANCEHVFIEERPDDEPNDSMDGDAASALASAGHGTDEDYEHGTPGSEDF